MGKLKGDFVSDAERKISKNGLERSSAKIIPPGSVILSSRAPISEKIRSLFFSFQKDLYAKPAEPKRELVH